MIKSNIKIVTAISFLILSVNTAYAQGALLDFFKPNQQSTTNTAIEEKYTIINETAKVNKSKVEVQEFFSFGCPHCHDFSNQFENWSKNEPKYVNVTKVPVTFDRPQWAALSRLYYTLNRLNLESYDTLVFEAIHKQGKQLYTEEAILDWVKNVKGINFETFKSTYNSEEVSNDLLKAKEYSVNYKIDSVPSIIVAGKYKINGKSGFKTLLSNTDEVVAKIHNGELK